MVKHFCTKCNKEVKSGIDLVDGELRVTFPPTEDRSEFTVLIQSRSKTMLQPTARDVCRQCLIDLLELSL